MPVTAKKRRGRPIGSKNKPTNTRPLVRKRGRPAGSKNRATTLVAKAQTHNDILAHCYCGSQKNYSECCKASDVEFKQGRAKMMKLLLQSSKNGMELAILYRKLDINVDVFRPTAAKVVRFVSELKLSAIYDDKSLPASVVDAGLADLKKASKTTEVFEPRLKYYKKYSKSDQIFVVSDAAILSVMDSVEKQVGERPSEEVIFISLVNQTLDNMRIS